eukprot:TRINITY_DN1056_c0_g1_i1.p1 TRINITY_DN1056_c0_g1~~TRINITY_DN1056_c0_g1_i1.p1  ORF type:complete len:215 (+),score=31.03 TRINITY_DN1056_c0_g1_i1:64-708(+)
MHGLGIGISGYMILANKLTTNRAVFLIELPWISMEFNCGDFPTKGEFTQDIETILSRHETPKVCLIGHSFGTFTTTWILHDKPELVQSIALIDPVCLLLPLPHLCRSALYRKAPDFWSWVIFLSTREMNTAYVLTRHFWWYQNTLWFQDIPENMSVSIILSEFDELAPTQDIEKYVMESKAPVNVEILRGLQHGQFLWSRQRCSQIADAILKNH